MNQRKVIDQLRAGGALQTIQVFRAAKQRSLESAASSPVGASTGASAGAAISSTGASPGASPGAAKSQLPHGVHGCRERAEGDDSEIVLSAKSARHTRAAISQSPRGDLTAASSDVAAATAPADLTVLAAAHPPSSLSLSSSSVAGSTTAAVDVIAPDTTRDSTNGAASVGVFLSGEGSTEYIPLEFVARQLDMHTRNLEQKVALWKSLASGAVNASVEGAQCGASNELQNVHLELKRSQELAAHLQDMLECKNVESIVRRLDMHTRNLEQEVTLWKSLASGAVNASVAGARCGASNELHNVHLELKRTQELVAHLQVILQL